MLEPDRRLGLVSGRPPLSTKGLRWARLCLLLFRPIVCVWFTIRQRTMERRVLAKLEHVAGCRERGELEQLLGKPRYAVGGRGVGAARPDGTRDSPDLIECYESEGCCIDLWFKDDRLIDVSGFVKPTVWDVALTGKAGRPDSHPADA
jgi:hypothetical protein